MAKKEKDPQSLDAQRAKEQQEAKKKLKAAEKSKSGGKDKAEGAKKAGGKKTGKKVARWLRDFRGEIKKITWPDFKTVMKNSGIVIVTVIVIGSLVWIVDFALTRAIGLAKTVAAGSSVSEVVEDPGDPDDAIDLPFEDPVIPELNLELEEDEETEEE